MNNNNALIRKKNYLLNQVLFYRKVEPGKSSLIIYFSFEFYLWINGLDMFGYQWSSCRFFELIYSIVLMIDGISEQFHFEHELHARMLIYHKLDWLYEREKNMQSIIHS